MFEVRYRFSKIDKLKLSYARGFVVETLLEKYAKKSFS